MDLQDKKVLIQHEQKPIRHKTRIQFFPNNAKGVVDAKKEGGWGWVGR